MAMRPTCEVYETAKGVKAYRVSVIKVSDHKPNNAVDEPNTADGDDIIVLSTVDLCPRALAQLVKKIVSGTTPPETEEESE